MTARKILLVSPAFHGYWKAIKASLESLGYQVSTHCYDAPSSVLGKIRNKVMHDLPVSHRWKFVADTGAKEAIEALRRVSPDIVVVIKGDQLGSLWWEELAHSRAACVTWLYDEVRRTRYSWEMLASIGPVASYSRIDAAHLNMMGVTSSYVPLAFDQRTLPVPASVNSVTFIGAKYPNRVDLLRSLQASGVPVQAYGKSWSRHPADIIRTRQWSNPGVSGNPDLNREQAYGVMAGSPATINIHGDQDGFTMRTFEASGVGALQLIDRTDVSEFYEIGSEIVAFENEAELTELANKAIVDPTWSKRIRAMARRRTLAEHTFDHRIKQLEELWG